MIAFNPNISHRQLIMLKGIAWLARLIVGKGIPNPLTVENLLKILRDLFPFDFTTKDRGKRWPLSPT